MPPLPDACCFHAPAAFPPIPPPQTKWYNDPNITFFAAVGPMTNAYLAPTLAAVAAAKAAGLKAMFLNVTGLPTDGCAGHPGIKGHRAMADAARPLIARALGW